MPDGRSVARNKFLNPLDQLVPVSKGGDANLLQVLVPHLGQDVHRDLLPVKHLPQLLQAKGGEEGSNAHVKTGLAGHHLRLGEVHATITRVGSWEGST